MTEAVLERMAPLFAEADLAFRTDPAYSIELATEGSKSFARREARRPLATLGRDERGDV
jgi:hypothetical protein